MQDPTERLIDVSRGELRAQLAGRAAARGEFDVLVDQMLTELAPEQVWNPAHPGWPQAQEVCRRAFLAETATEVEYMRRDIRQALVTAFEDLTEADTQAAIAFFESAAGIAWLDGEEARLRELAQGTPFAWTPAPAQTGSARVAEIGPAADLIRRQGLADEAARKSFEYKIEIVSYESRDALLAALRSGVADVLPMAATGDYVGMVTMDASGALDVIVEYRSGYQVNARYPFRYEPGALHYDEVLAAVPGIQPDEMRVVYRTATGALRDRP